MLSNSRTAAKRCLAADPLRPRCYVSVRNERKEGTGRQSADFLIEVDESAGRAIAHPAVRARWLGMDPKGRHLYVGASNTLTRDRFDDGDNLFESWR